MINDINLANLTEVLEMLNKRLYNIEKNLVTIGEVVVDSHDRDNKIIKSAMSAMQFFLAHYAGASPDELTSLFRLLAEENSSTQHSQKASP